MNNLKIVLMNGDLASQLSQYTFLRFLEKNVGEKCIVDDSAFWGSGIKTKEVELERIFGIKLNKLSSCFSPDVWEEMITNREKGISIPQQLMANGLNITIIAENDECQFLGNIILYNPNIIGEETLNLLLKARGNIYYYGNFTNITYVKLMIKTLYQELKFPLIRESLERDTINARYVELIRLTNSVAVYIQRNNCWEYSEVDIISQKYAKAIRSMENTTEEYTYFIFSDDIQWCKKNKKDLGLIDIKGDYIFVEENVENSCIDIQLMSYCKYMIISNTSLGKWGYLFNRICDEHNVIWIDKV